jgi:hypothetical protein
MKKHQIGQRLGTDKNGEKVWDVSQRSPDMAQQEPLAVHLTGNVRVILLRLAGGV